MYDSKNLLPNLDRDLPKKPHDELFWRNGYIKACLIGDWKLYISQKDKKVFFFNLANGPKEANNLTKLYPERVKKLSGILKSWEQTQTVNPLWPSSLGVRININKTYFWFPT